LPGQSGEVLPAVLNDFDCRAKCVRFEVADAALETLQYSELSAVLVRMPIPVQVDAARDQQAWVPQDGTYRASTDGESNRRVSRLRADPAPGTRLRETVDPGRNGGANDTALVLLPGSAPTEAKRAWRALWQPVVLPRVGRGLHLRHVLSLF
jgi:hypothetical protein